jgi:predicted esterase
MPAWSDIPNLDFTGPEDEAGMRASIASIHALIAHEVGAAPDARVVLGGFSQGAGLSLLMGLTAEKRFAGLAVLSGRLPIRDVVKAVRAIHFSFP